MIKRGVKFAGRVPQFAGDLFSRNYSGIGFQTYTQRLRTQRKTVIHSIKKLEKSSKLEEMVEMEVEELISRLLGKQLIMQDVTELKEDIAFAHCNVVSSLAFGERFREKNLEISELLGSLAIFAKSLAATAIIDAFPLLKYIPFKIIEKLKMAISVRDKMLNTRYMHHKDTYLNKNHIESDDLTYALLEEAEKFKGRHDEQLTEDHILMTINDVIIAGSESPSTNMSWIIYFLIKYPQIQQRLQKELDDVVGRHRSPRWMSDQQLLPYLEAFITETMRHAIAMPLAIPHEVAADSYLGPYQIPKGTTVLLNLYAIHHDPEMWHNPQEFNPDRFLKSDGSFNTESSSKVIPYGIGRRSCPGEMLARMEVFLFTSTLLQKFLFTADDNVVLPDVDDGAFGLVLQPPPFNVRVQSRF